jgi:hypothetical protein
MQKQTELFLGLVCLSVFFPSCKKNEPDKPPNSSGKGLRFARDMARQMGVSGSLKGVRVQTRASMPDFDRTPSYQLDLSQAVNILFTISGGEIISVTSVPLADKTNMYLEMIEYKNTNLSLVIETSFDRASSLFRAKLVPAKQTDPMSGLSDCIRNVWGSELSVVLDAGNFLTGTGQAVAGLLTGVSMLSCIGTT